VPLDAALNKEGLTLRQLGIQLRNAADAHDALKASEKEMEQVMETVNAAINKGLTPMQEHTKTVAALWVALSNGRITNDHFIEGLQGANDKLTGVTEKLDHAKEIVKQAQTPQEKYNDELTDLNLALARGVITQHGYDEGLKAIADTLDGAQKMSHELNQAVKDLAAQGISQLVDMAFGAKESFSDFVRSAIMDLTKLILKIELLKVLFPAESGGKFLGGIFGFASGGFLGGGRLGVVGEAGPELIQAGRQGVTITPFPSMGTTGSAGGGVTYAPNITLAPQAIDQRGVHDFFRNNPGYVASAMITAMRKSDALRRMMGGR